MNIYDKKVVVTGLGVLTPIGVGLTSFIQALRNGKTNFSEVEFEHLGLQYQYPGALINDFEYKSEIEKLPLKDDLKKKAKQLRNLSVGTTHGIYTAMEAWLDSGLNNTNINSEKVALITSGSNTQQGTLFKTQERYREKLQFMNPTYGFGFFDTDIIGCLSELLGIRGEGHSIGAASASGTMALIQGCRLIAGGDYDVVFVVAPSMELSIYEYQGFTALGAMATLKDDKNISQLNNPFDKEHCGFVYGQNAGALILESENHAAKRKAKIKAAISGYGIVMDANRNPNPSAIGEAKSMRKALSMGNIFPEQIDYINTHGTASVIGDQTEVEAIVSLGVQGVKTNATKGLIGHGISSAGIVEAIASILQMNHGFIHPNPNLKNPITNSLGLMKQKSETASINYALSNSFGFGGINTSILLKNIK